MLTKRQIRSKILFKLQSQKEEIRNRKSKVISKKLLRRAVYKKAKIVMFYLSKNREVNTQEMISAALAQGKVIAVPVVDRKTNMITPCKIGLGTRFTVGQYGILEPVKKCRIAPEKIGLVVVPGVAFDKKGSRLGRGKGYYDRLLKNTRSFKLGLAYSWQIVDKLPEEKEDVLMDMVLTEKSK